MNSTFFSLVLFLLMSTCFQIEEQESEPEKSSPKVSFTISKETTYVTEPIRGSGIVDYAPFINQQRSEGVTDENNAAVLLNTIFYNQEREQELTETENEEMLVDLKKIKFPDESVDDEEFAAFKPITLLPEFEELDPIRKAHVREHWIEYLGSVEANLSSDLVDAYVKHNLKTIEYVNQATSRPYYYYPIKHVYDTRIAHPEGLEEFYKKITLLLYSYVVREASNGEMSRAMEGLRSLNKIAQYYVESEDLDGPVIGFAIMFHAEVLHKFILSELDKNDSEWKSALGKLDQRPYPGFGELPIVSMTRCRLLALIQIRDVKRKSFDGISEVLLGNNRAATLVKQTIGYNWNADEAMRTVNRFFDEVQVELSDPISEESQIQWFLFTGKYGSEDQLYELLGSLGTGALSRLLDTPDARKSRGETYGKYATLKSFADLVYMEQSRLLRIEQSQHIRIGYGIRAFEAKHGRMPATLEEVHAEHPEITVTSIFGDAIRYTTKGKRDFQLWSPGVDAEFVDTVEDAKQNFSGDAVFETSGYSEFNL